MKKLLLIILLCPFFVMRCYAEDLGSQIGTITQADLVETSLPEEVRTISGALRLDAGYDTEGALKRLYSSFMSQCKERLSSSIRSAAELFIIALLCAITESFCETTVIREAVDRIVCCIASLFVFGNFSSVVDETADAVRTLTDYAHVALPILFTTAAAGGGIVSASTRFASACLSMDVMLTIAQSWIIPLIYMFFSVSVSQSLYENNLLQAASRISKWCVTSALTVLAMAFGAYLSLTGLIAGSGDALAVKTARTVLSRSLPVVGGLLSDSAAVLLSAAALVKNSVGVFALIAVCALCIGPVAAFSVKLLVFKAVAAAIDFLPGARLPKLVSAMSSVYAMLLGLIGCCASIFFIAIVSGIKVVSPL